MKKHIPEEADVQAEKPFRMNITVQSIRFDADTKLIDFIREKLLKLSQFTDEIHAAEVFLRLEHDGDNRENKVGEVKLAAKLMGGRMFEPKASLANGHTGEG